MPKYIFQMGVDARAYGSVEAEAEDIDAAIEMLTADYVGENIEPSETTWDNLTNLTIIDVTDEDGNETAPEYQGTDLPSEYDPPSPRTFVRFEYGQEDRMGDPMGPYPFVQATYDSIRVGPDGDQFIANFVDGLWVTEDGQKWSDFVVFAA